MLYALWNGEIINAEEISENWETEKQVKQNNGKDNLRCVDPSCQYPSLLYCHGKIRRAYFSHAKKGDCDYGDFDKSDNSELKEARTVLFEHFKSLGYDVERERKLPGSRMYSHLLLNIDGKNIVVQIAQSTTSAKYINSLEQECQKCGYELRWVVLGSYDESQREKENYYAMRYQYNESNNKDLLILDIEYGRISQHKIDESDYHYKSNNLGGDKYFRMDRPIGSLRVEDGELTLDGFNESYNTWLAQKKENFEKKKRQLDELDKKWVEVHSQKRASSAKSLLANGNLPSPKSSSAAKSKISVTPEMINQFKVGARVKHKNLDEGEVISISEDPVTHLHNVEIQYKYKRRKHTLEELLENQMIKCII